MDKVIQNILDPNTKATAKRKICLLYTSHAKKARTRKKHRNRIRRYVFEALACLLYTSRCV